VRIKARKELTLESGGAFIQFKDGSITLGGPGDLFLKVITVQKKGKASQEPNFEVLPSGKVGDLSNVLEIVHHYDDLEPVRNAPYKVRLKDGATLSGTLDDKGYIRLDGVPRNDGTVELGEDVRKWMAGTQKPSDYLGKATDRQSAANLFRSLQS
jgi:type VI secretion system secreted protein VgrG